MVVGRHHLIMLKPVMVSLPDGLGLFSPRREEVVTDAPLDLVLIAEHPVLLSDVAAATVLVTDRTETEVSTTVSFHVIDEFFFVHVTNPILRFR